MNDELITSDAPLTAAEQEVLDALLDTIVPASADGERPSARDVDFLRFAQSNAAELLADLSGILAHFDAEFASAPLTVRYERVRAYSAEAPERFDRLLSEVYACYYQDARVLEAIGVGAGPPFPRGNTVEPGDLSLLDPVSRNATTWRRAGL